ncbi:MAG: hypothetical protein HUK22_06805, partial [Thermoguttaceae bacterium]|nr:hypothetical protein [Thermoguttaceae bacterium]
MRRLSNVRFRAVSPLFAALTIALAFLASTALAQNPGFGAGAVGPGSRPSDDSTAIRPGGTRPGAVREGTPLPSQRYYSGAQFIEDGDFVEATMFYREEVKHRDKQLVVQEYLDCICYYAMLGETSYQSGMLEAALDYYKSALVIALTFPKWLQRVTPVAAVTTRPKMTAPWGTSARPYPVAEFPTSCVLTTGDIITQDRLKQGGIMKDPQNQRIDPVEIMRCVALCI